MNETIKTQLNHRSIRQFKSKALTQEEVNLLVDVARHTSTSNFRQAYSIISITDEKLKEQISEIANQPYIPKAGHLFVVVVDQRRNTLIAEAKGAEVVVQGSPERFISAFSDAMIATQNMVVAAESLGMGAVYLGSILNDNAKLSELLKLPKSCSGLSSWLAKSGTTAETSFATSRHPYGKLLSGFGKSLGRT